MSVNTVVAIVIIFTKTQLST